MSASIDLQLPTSVLPYVSVDHMMVLIGMMKAYVWLKDGKRVPDIDEAPPVLAGTSWANPDYNQVSAPTATRFRNQIELTPGAGEAQRCVRNVYRYVRQHPDSKLLALPGVAVWEHADKLEDLEDFSLEPHMVVFNVRSRIAKDVTSRPGYSGKVHFVPLKPTAVGGMGLTFHDWDYETYAA